MASFGAERAWVRSARAEWLRLAQGLFSLPTSYSMSKSVGETVLHYQYHGRIENRPGFFREGLGPGHPELKSDREKTPWLSFERL
jgi:hypothetical protein